jgi:hypothetical protein
VPHAANGSYDIASSSMKPVRQWMLFELKSRFMSSFQQYIKWYFSLNEYFNYFRLSELYIRKVKYFLFCSV